MAEVRPGPSSGLLASLGQLGSRLLGMVETRVKLLALDLEEERRYFMGLVIAILLAAVCLGMALGLFTLTVLVLYWDTHRLAVLLTLAAGYSVAGLVLVGATMMKVRAKSAPFASSLAELRKDAQALVVKNT